jgi:hypothetical protein
MTSCVVPISVWKGWNSVLQIWNSNLLHKASCLKPFWIGYHWLLGNHLQPHMRNSNERTQRLAEDVQLSAYGRHPTAHPFIFFLCLFYFTFIFVFVFLCYFSVLFSRNKCVSVQVWGGCFEPYLLQPVSPKPRSALSIYLHIGDNVQFKFGGMGDIFIYTVFCF